MSQSNKFLSKYASPALICLGTETWRNEAKPQNIRTIKGFIEEYDWWKEVGGEEAVEVGVK